MKAIDQKQDDSGDEPEEDDIDVDIEGKELL